MEQFSSDTREIPSLMLNKIIQVMSKKWNNLVYFTYLNLQNYPFRLAFENHLKSAFLVGHRQTWGSVSHEPYQRRLAAA